MQENDAQRLLEKFRAGECTEQEKIRLRNWFHTINAELPSGLNAEELENIGTNIWQDLNLRTKPVPVRRLWRRIAAAASVIAILGAGTYLLTNNPSKPKPTANDISPYSAMAILKTGGKTIILDQAKNGRIAETQVIKSKGEQLAYANTNEETKAIYDTIQIPEGGRPYTVKLSDGSKVTLNTATSLRYPQHFSAKRNEEVELISGEIYAEVVHQENAPIKFIAPKQQIEDIGTSFNINAYPDETESRTTLVEGAINVNNRKLKPGQQAVITGNTLDIIKVDVDAVTAWKDGDFSFNGEHIEVIMRQLARWYNIEVVYEGKKTEEVFYGRITRKKNISEVLKVLERTQKIHFKIDGRRVTVLNKK
jgi:ferric-dicitrate binding protein FerR (iron transport regulator)